MENYSPLSITNFKKKKEFKIPSFFKFKLKKKAMLLFIFGLLVLGGMSWFANQYLTSFFATQNIVAITPPSDINQTKSAGEPFIVTFNIAPQTAGQVVTAFSLVLEYDKDKVEYDKPADGSGVVLAQSDIYDILEENNNSEEGKVYLTIVNNSATDIANQLSFKFKTKSDLTTEQLNQSTQIRLFNVTETAGESLGVPIEFVRSDTSPIILANINFPTPSVGTPSPSPSPTPILPTATPDPTADLKNIKVNFTFKLQGVPTLPRNPEAVDFEVIIIQNDSQIKKETVSFTPQTDGTYKGEKDFNGIDLSKKYSISAKGEKHLKKIVCENNPTETVPGTYNCESSNITFVEGENNLNFSNIYFLVGDIPIQDGIVNSIDIAYVRQNFGNTAPESLVRGDLNFDGIVDTQDYALIIYALGFKYDEGI